MSAIADVESAPSIWQTCFLHFPSVQSLWPRSTCSKRQTLSLCMILGSASLGVAPSMETVNRTGTSDVVNHRSEGFPAPPAWRQWIEQKQVMLLIIEARDSPHGIFGPWAWWSRGLTKWGELLGRRRCRRRRRRHLGWVWPHSQGFRPNLSQKLTKYEQKCNFFKIGMSKKSAKSHFLKIKGTTWTQALPWIYPKRIISFLQRSQKWGWPHIRTFGNVLLSNCDILPKIKMVRMVHGKLFYEMGLEISDEKKELGRKSKKIEGSNKSKISPEVQN